MEVENIEIAPYYSLPEEERIKKSVEFKNKGNELFTRIK